MIMKRRGFFGALAGLVAAPMVVKAEAIMPVRAWRDLPPKLWGDGIHDDTAALQWLLNRAGPSGVYHMPPGDFLITDTLRFVAPASKPLLVSGQGSRLIARNVRGAVFDVKHNGPGLVENFYMDTRASPGCLAFRAGT